MFFLKLNWMEIYNNLEGIFLIGRLYDNMIVGWFKISIIL